MSKETNGIALLIAKQLAFCEGCPKKEESLKSIHIEVEENGKKKTKRELNDKICNGCEHFKETRRLSTLLKDKNSKTKDLLEKGENMTTQELLFVLDSGVHKASVQSALNMPKDEFDYMVKSLCAYDALAMERSC